MNRSEKHDVEFGGNRVVPESPFEVDVVRQAILADKWDLPVEQQAEYARRWPLSGVGGQAVFHPEWSPKHVVHYSVGGHLDDGFFGLDVSIHGERSVAGFSLLAALVVDHKPWFQTGWQGPHRGLWMCPQWFFRARRASPVGLRLKSGVSRGVLMIGAVSKTPTEWECLSLHVSLVNSCTLKNHSPLA